MFQSYHKSYFNIKINFIKKSNITILPSKIYLRQIEFFFRLWRINITLILISFRHELWLIKLKCYIILVILIFLGTKKKINQNEEEGSNRDNSNSRQLGNNVKPKTQHKEVDESVKSNPEENGNVLKKIRLNASQLHSGRQSTDSVSRFATDQIACDLSDDKEPPELVSTDELKQRSGKGSVCSDETIKISLAEEVIVANIHEKFSVLYILYLLEKFEPISITEIKTISRNGVRYCSVYFKSQKDAIAVERQFDNFDLSGNKLIVRTPQLLVKEVSTVWDN